MLQSIPTRIVGARIFRQTASRRTDGSTVLIRRLASAAHSGCLPHAEVISADFAFTSEPSYLRVPVERTVSCLAGEAYLCLVDVRQDSPSFGQWQSFRLSERDARSVSVPAGVASGWQILSETATLEVRASQEFAPRRLHWLQWNDPDLQLAWPERPRVLANHVRRSRRLQAIADRRLPRLHQSPCTAREPSVRKSSSLSSSARSGLNLNAVASTPRRESPTGTTPSHRGIEKVARQPAARSAQSPHRGQSPTSELILVVGSSGQLGRDLCRQLRSLGTVIGACRTADKGSLLPVPVLVDISRPASLRQAIRHVRPTLIVNAAGLTDPDLAEQQPRLAQLVNATAPAIMADEAHRIGASLIHFCSGMVFNGTGDKPWRETDQPQPLNQYARTKLIGTTAIGGSSVSHLILRCGWLYSTHGDNFVRRLIDSMSYRNSVTLADDQIGSPTSTNLLAKLTTEILTRARSAAHENCINLREWLQENGGLYHASALGCASKLEVGDQILALCRQHALPIVLQKLQGRPLNELPSLAAIPHNTALDPTRLAMKFQLVLPRWQADLAEQVDLMLGAHHGALASVA